MVLLLMLLLKYLMVLLKYYPHQSWFYLHPIGYGDSGKAIKISGNEGVDEYGLWFSFIYTHYKILYQSKSKTIVKLTYPNNHLMGYTFDPFVIFIISNHIDSHE